MSEHASWAGGGLGDAMARLIELAHEDERRILARPEIRRALLAGRKSSISLWHFGPDGFEPPEPPPPPTVVELREAYRTADRIAADAFDEMQRAERRWMRATEARTRAAKLLDTAEWEMRVASERWVAGRIPPDPGQAIVPRPSAAPVELDMASRMALLFDVPVRWVRGE